MGPVPFSGLSRKQKEEKNKHFRLILQTNLLHWDIFEGKIIWDGYLDESLKTFVFGVKLLVEVHSFIVSAAELPIDLLHSLTTGTWELGENKCGKIVYVTYNKCSRDYKSMHFYRFSTVPFYRHSLNIQPQVWQLKLTWETSTSPIFRITKPPSSWLPDSFFLSSNCEKNCVCKSRTSSNMGNIFSTVWTSSWTSLSSPLL